MGKSISISRRWIFLIQLFALTTAGLSFNNNDNQSNRNIEERQARVQGGQEIGIIRHPYIVSIRRKSSDNGAYKHYCCGTIFTDDMIITAASCVQGVTPRQLHIVAGSSLLSNSLQDLGMIFPVEQFIIHENGNVDLALLKLGIKLPLSTTETIGAVTLATSTPKTGTTAVIAGWGTTTEDGSFSEKLRETEISITDSGECLHTPERDDIENYEICASAKTCNGDAGGPLLVNNQLAGIIPWIEGCGSPGTARIYTNIARMSEWIVYHALGVRKVFL